MFIEPEYDLDYILNPINLAAIRDNIIHRKRVGDIDSVVSMMWARVICV